MVTNQHVATDVVIQVSNFSKLNFLFITHTSDSQAMSRVISCICDCACACLCLSLHSERKNAKAINSRLHKVDIPVCWSWEPDIQLRRTTANH